MITLADIRSNATETSLFICFRQRNRTLNIRAKTVFASETLNFNMICPFKLLIFAFLVGFSFLCVFFVLIFAFQVLLILCCIAM